MGETTICIPHGEEVEFLRTIDPMFKTQLAMLRDFAKILQFINPLAMETQIRVFQIKQQISSIIIVSKSYHRFLKGKKSVMNSTAVDNTAKAIKNVQLIEFGKNMDFLKDYCLKGTEMAVVTPSTIYLNRQVLVKDFKFNMQLIVKLEVILRTKFTEPFRYDSLMKTINAYILKQKLQLCKRQLYARCDHQLTAARHLFSIENSFVNQTICQTKREISMTNNVMPAAIMPSRSISNCNLEVSSDTPDSSEKNDSVELVLSEESVTSFETFLTKELFKQSIEFNECLKKELSSTSDLEEDLLPVTLEPAKESLEPLDEALEPLKETLKPLEETLESPKESVEPPKELEPLNEYLEGDKNLSASEEEESDNAEEALQPAIIAEEALQFAVIAQEAIQSAVIAEEARQSPEPPALVREVKRPKSSNLPVPVKTPADVKEEQIKELVMLERERALVMMETFNNNIPSKAANKTIIIQREWKETDNDLPKILPEENTRENTNKLEENLTEPIVEEILERVCVQAKVNSELKKKEEVVAPLKLKLESKVPKRKPISNLTRPTPAKKLPSIASRQVQAPVAGPPKKFEYLRRAPKTPIAPVKVKMTNGMHLQESKAQMNIKVQDKKDKPSMIPLKATPKNTRPPTPKPTLSAWKKQPDVKKVPPKKELKVKRNNTLIKSSYSKPTKAIKPVQIVKPITETLKVDVIQEHVLSEANTSFPRTIQNVYPEVQVDMVNLEPLTVPWEVEPDVPALITNLKTAEEDVQIPAAPKVEEYKNKPTEIKSASGMGCANRLPVYVRRSLPKIKSTPSTESTSVKPIRPVIANKSPTNFVKAEASGTLPSSTLWTPYSKPELPVKPVEKKEEEVKEPKVYKYETKEVLIGNKVSKVTYLVEEKNEL